MIIVVSAVHVILIASVRVVDGASIPCSPTSEKTLQPFPLSLMAVGFFRITREKGGIMDECEMAVGFFRIRGCGCS